MRGVPARISTGGPPPPADRKCRTLLGFWPAASIALVGLAGSPAPPPPAPLNSAEAAYIRRGAQLEASFNERSRQLEQAYQRLAEFLRDNFPQLLDDLKEKPPVRLKSGYQILPEILPDDPPPVMEGRDFFNSYSWPRTENLLAGLSSRVAALADDVETAISAPDKGGAPRFAKLVSDYKTIEKDRGSIENHIRHNRLWQEQIAKSPEIFQRGTVLYHLAVERQDVLDRLADGAADPALREKERALLEEIREGQSRTWRPAYLRTKQTRNGVWVVEAPLYTDIEDAAFLQELRRIVEFYWRYEDAEVRFRLDLIIQPIPAVQLYSRSRERRSSNPGAGGAPAHGDPVDLDRHLSLFPADGAALTTGADKIHARGRFILLGPEPVAPRTLAHEFGHILGFRDEYVRGYRDLGEDGYEILEASPDPGDIMCSSGTGAVLKRHFELLTQH